MAQLDLRHDERIGPAPRWRDASLGDRLAVMATIVAIGGILAALCEAVLAKAAWLFGHMN
jgi:hypothetical protein